MTERLALATRATVRIAEHIDGGTLPPETFDLGRAIHGATLRETAKGRFLELGDRSSLAWPPSSVLTLPRFLLRMRITEESIKQGKHPVAPNTIHFELLLPHRTKLSTESLEGTMTIDIDMLHTELGDPVRFNLQATVGPSHRKVRFELEVNTFLRDVVKGGTDSVPTEGSAGPLEKTIPP